MRTTKFKTIVTVTASLAAASGCTGTKLGVKLGGSLGNNVLSDAGATRVEGGSYGSIFNVTTVVNANFYSLGNTNYTLDVGGQAFPFTDGDVLGQLPYSASTATYQNKHTPFHFKYDYPSNNYKLANARLVVELNRDDSGTEAIFIDGVLTGKPVCNMVNVASTALIPAYRMDEGSSASVSCTAGIPTHSLAPKNRNFNKLQAEYYRPYAVNFADFDIDKLIEWTLPAGDKPDGYPTTRDLVSDGTLLVATSDDTPVYQAKLFLNGYTISKTALSCASPVSHDFRNVYVHNDGNSIGNGNGMFPFKAPGGGSAGTQQSPYQTTVVGDQAVNFYYAPLLPNVPVANITITRAKISRFNDSQTDTGLVIRRNTAVPSAIIVNGVAIAQTGFDTTRFNTDLYNGTPIVQEVLTGSSQTYWESWLALSNAAIAGNNFTVPPGTDSANSLDLIQLLGGMAKLRGLLAQGKLDISFAGGISVVQGAGPTTARVSPSMTIVNGPELALRGTFTTTECAVPNDPSSPLTDTGELPDPATDVTSPEISSIQVVEITNSTAKVQWLTDEPADSEVVADSGTTTPETVRYSDTEKVIFHEALLTGLSPYTKHFFQIKSKDASTATVGGNLSTSNVGTFTTKR